MGINFERKYKREGKQLLDLVLVVVGVVLIVLAGIGLLS